MEVRRRLRTIISLPAHYVVPARTRFTRWRLAIVDRAAPRAALAYLLLLTLIERPRAAIRRRRALRPRLIWGPVPIISLKYWAEAMREAGYESRTCVTLHYPIHKREDFDVYLDRFAGETPLSQQLAPYRFFAWVLRHGDVFIRFLDGGFLRHTRHEWLEERLITLAGKKVIVSPYGGDIAVAGHLDGLEHALYTDYPSLEETTDEIGRWVEHTSRWADLVVKNWQLGYLPRYDVVWLSQLAIDLDHWKEAGTDSGSDGRNGEVTVLHAPNHRKIKGTEYLERAVDQLRGEGLKIKLELLQGRPNEEIRAAMMASDVIADQFLLQGYAMAAVEAMAAGKPVMVNMSALPDELRSTEAGRQCPAVDTNPERLLQNLRELVENPALRRELGSAGRRFVERFHSYPEVARTWERLIDHVWRGAPLPASLLPRRTSQAVGARRRSERSRRNEP